LKIRKKLINSCNRGPGGVVEFYTTYSQTQKKRVDVDFFDAQFRGIIAANRCDEFFPQQPRCEKKTECGVSGNYYAQPHEYLPADQVRGKLRYPANVFFVHSIISILGKIRQERIRNRPRMKNCEYAIPQSAGTFVLH